MELPGPVAGPEDGQRAPRHPALAEVAAVVLGWVVTRGLVVLLFFGVERSATNSLRYIARSLAAEPVVGVGHTLVEYPVPGVDVLWVPWFVVHQLGVPHAYPVGVLVLCLVTDAAFMLFLARFGGARRGPALAVWLLAVPLLGATAYARLDIVPGVLSGAALLLLVARPARSGGLLALAAALKLWPALVIPAMAAPRATRRAVLSGAIVLGGALAAAVLALDGWARLVSPLTWQAHRGLQIEAVPATPAMVAWGFGTPGFHVAFTRFKAFEISGPWTPTLVRASGVLTLVLVVCLLLMWRAAWRKGTSVGMETVAWLSFTAVTAFIVASKVLSPQYLLWLLPLAAAATVSSSSRALRGWVALLLVTTALTQLEYPLGYTNLEARAALTTPTVLVLVARNVLLVVLLGWAAANGVRGLRRAGGGTADAVAA